MFNVWNLLLSGLAWIVNTAILPLFGDVPSQLASIHFAQLITQNAYIVLELTYDLLGSIVNLTLFIIFFVMLLTTFMFRMVISIYKFIKELIPVVG